MGVGLGCDGGIIQNSDNGTEDGMGVVVRV
jgi:hypothetical protein